MGYPVESLFEETGMTQERLPVRKIREVIRLHHEAGLSNRAIARVCKVSNSTVGEYLERAEQIGIGWPLPEGLLEDALYQQLFPEKAEKNGRPVPDWGDVRRELSKRGVTLRLLWREYREKHPNGYGLTQFLELYKNWSKAQTNTMRLPHKGGDEMEVDYAGMTVPITNPETGEITRAGGDPPTQPYPGTFFDPRRAYASQSSFCFGC
jgi:transposase